MAPNKSWPWSAQRRIGRTALVGGVALAWSAPLPGQRAADAPREPAPLLWAGLLPGNQHVGYRRIETPRGVVHLWYPTAADGAHLRFRDYLGDHGAGVTAFLKGASISDTTVARLLNTTLYATQTAHPSATALPLVLIAHGNGQDVTDQVVLSEYLASHGFAVAATPSPMLVTPMKSEEQLPSLAESQADDLAAAVGATRTIVKVDSQRVAVIGHSFGARSALLLAMRGTPRLKAIVSLDGGIGTPTALEQFRRAPSFRMDATLPPLLHFSETLDGFMAPDFTLLKSLQIAELTLESTTDLRHTHFTTWGFAAAVIPELARVTRATANTGAVVRAVHEKVHQFLREAMNRR